MFIRAGNTYTVETCLDEEGVTSLVLVPLPFTSEQVEDIGPHLFGSYVGSVMLVKDDNHTQVAISSGLGVVPSPSDKPPAHKTQTTSVSSSPLSSPPASDDEQSEDETSGLNDFEKSYTTKTAYEFGQKKTVYKANKRYMAYQSQTRSPLVQPPPPPFGHDIPLDSLYANTHEHPNSSEKVLQLWVYTTKPRRGKEWQSIARGSTQTFGDTVYYIQWKTKSGPSWVKNYS